MAEIKKRLYFISYPGFFFFLLRNSSETNVAFSGPQAMNFPSTESKFVPWCLQENPGADRALVLPQYRAIRIWECTIPAQTGAKFPALGSSVWKTR